MQVSVEVRDRRNDDRPRLTLGPVGVPSPLVHEAHIGAGVHVRLDLLAPDRWTALSVDDLDDASAPLLAALIGEPAVRGLQGRSTGTASLDVKLVAAGPWMRVAAVDALDRWLHLPLDQALVDAERGVARAQAAATLPTDNPAVPLVIGDALQLARRGSAGLVKHLRRCGPMPARLRAAMADLVGGYADLAGRVNGPDRDLAAVQDAWQAHLAGTATAETPSAPVVGRHSSLRSRGCPSDESSMIDPRRVMARVLGLSADPSAGEVRLSRDPAADAVLVEVPAFCDLDQGSGRRMLVRLIDRRSSDQLGHGLLVIAPGRPSRRGGRRYFRCTVPLPGLDVVDLQADVYDSLNAPPPAAGDVDPHLRDARRASVFLGEWRRLVALAHTTTVTAGLGDRVRDLARRLGGAPGSPAFGGGPTATDLLQMVDADDIATAGRLRAAGETVVGIGSLRSAGGMGHLLVAELVSALEETLGR